MDKENYEVSNTTQLIEDIAKRYGDKGVGEYLKNITRQLKNSGYKTLIICVNAQKNDEPITTDDRLFFTGTIMSPDLRKQIYKYIEEKMNEQRLRSNQ